MKNNMKNYAIGNWKMHGSKAHVETFCSALASFNQNKLALQSVNAFCPPFTYLSLAAQLLEQAPHFQLGAQDVSNHQIGPFTGQIAASMLAEIGCKFVIVGHSERRQYCKESDEEIAEKFLAVKAAGMIPILCVGETRAQREADETASVVTNQLTILLSKEGGAANFKQAILAYEPIWAIGTGLTATPDEAQKVHGLLRETIAEYDSQVAEMLPILYGGSVKSSTVPGLIAMKDINGVLVGGASLNAEEFMSICEALSRA